MLGIFQIKITQNQCCYFIKRPFGNLLFFADHLENIGQETHSLFIAHGGVSKMFLESTQSINDTHGELFHKYGASVVCDLAKDHFDKRVPVEKLKEFTGTQILFKYHFDKKYIILKQNKQMIMLVGKEVKLISKSYIDYKGINISNEILELKERHQINFIYFTSFESDSVLVSKKQTIWDKVLQKINF